MFRRVAHLHGRVRRVIEQAQKAGDRLLKVDVVLPQRVVGIEQKGLGLEHLEVRLAESPLGATLQGAGCESAALIACWASGAMTR